MRCLMRMRNFLILAITSCVLAQGFCFSRRVEENDESELEEEDYEGAGDGPDDDNAVNEVGDARSYNQEKAADAEEEDSESQPEVQAANDASQRATDDETPDANRYKFSGLNNFKKTDAQDNSVDLNSIYRSQLKQRKFSTLNGVKANDGAEDSQGVFNDFKLQSGDQLNRRTLASRITPNEEGLLPVQNPSEKEDKRRYNSDSVGTSDISQFTQAFHRNPPVDKASNKKTFKFRRFYLNRDRRNSEGKSEDSFSNDFDSKVLDNVGIANEEASIKRNVQKLSSDELDELLSSLTDDKKELLRNIMGNDFSDKNNIGKRENSIDKREITKKAGLQAENVDIGQSDAGKFEEVNARDVDCNCSSMPKSSSSSMPESSDITISKALEAPKSSLVSKADSVHQIEEQKIDNSEISLKSDSSVSNNLATQNTETITDTKRDVNVQNNDKAIIHENSQAAASFEDGDLSQRMMDETELHEENKNTFKRQASENEVEFSDSLRSLQESFPKPKSYVEYESYFGSAPLIRVKRKNDVAKVAYFSYRAEEDDDSEEGNEMGDDGYYDRSSNLALNVDDKTLEDEPVRAQSGKPRSNPDNAGSDQFSNEDIEGERSLGSDTDGVLSGVEGVDDNLMFSNSARNRREPEEKENPETEVEKEAASNRTVRSTPYMGDEVTVTKNFISASNLPIESDAFGALPRNYDGDLGRYKRVRRVKETNESVSDTIHQDNSS